jgi:hypothetical protein
LKCEKNIKDYLSVKRNAIKDVEDADNKNLKENRLEHKSCRRFF